MKPYRLLNQTPAHSKSVVIAKAIPSFLDCFVPFASLWASACMFLVMTFFLFVSTEDVLAKVSVVSSVPNFAAITEEIGGDKVEVISLSKGYQDPHFVDAKPSLILSLNRADLLLYTGLELEIGWLPAIITGARNSKILTGNIGNLDCSTLISNLLETPTTRVDRSMGDIHPGGNPHYMLDPRNGIAVAKGIADRLKEIDPKNVSYYDERLADFAKRLNTKIKEWDEKLFPYKGTEIVTYHKSWVYFSGWAGFKEVGYIEPKPGVPPSPSYVAELIKKLQEDKIRLIIAESYYPKKVPTLIAEKTGASFLVQPSSVGARDGINTYFDLFDVIVGEVVSKLASITMK